MDRRKFLLSMLGAGGAAVAGAAVVKSGLLGGASAASARKAGTGHLHLGHPMGLSAERQVEGGITPMEYLTAFDLGRPSTVAGRAVRDYSLTASPAMLEVARGVLYPGWTYNGHAPGPTLRATEGDVMRVAFTNADVHPHTIHFHGIHPANMDGVFEPVNPGGAFGYEFEAKPFGLHLYHCHTLPLSKHIAKGLYGAFIVDPPTPRPPAREMVMVMNAFDVDFDGENEFYTVNGIANYYMDHPIPVKVGELQRIYLVNVTEFDLLNSFHLHAGMFRLYRTGTRLDDHEITDTVILGQGERAILEFTLDTPGRYMFHAHQSEFAELGWVGLFDARA